MIYAMWLCGHLPDIFCCWNETKKKKRFDEWMSTIDINELAFLAYGRTNMQKDLKYDKALRKRLKNGYDVNKPDNYGNTAIIYAAMYNSIKFIRMLVQQGADVNHQNLNGNTALIKASVHGRLDIIRRLIKDGADVNIKNRNVRDALMLVNLKKKYERRYDIKFYNQYVKVTNILKDNGAKL